MLKIICLPMQETQVQSLVQEDAREQLSPWATAADARTPHRDMPPHGEAQGAQLEKRIRSRDPAQPKINEKSLKRVLLPISGFRCNCSIRCQTPGLGQPKCPSPPPNVLQPSPFQHLPMPKCQRLNTSLIVSATPSSVGVIQSSKYLPLPSQQSSAPIQTS